MPDTVHVQLLSGNDGLNLTTIISLLVGVLGLLFGIYQYVISKRWKRMEYLDALMKRFREEPLLKSAGMLLDWETRPILIGDRTVDYNVTMLAHALIDHRTFKDPFKEGFTDDEAAIRDAFDALFDFCVSIQYAIELGMVKNKDVFSSPIAYYLSKVIEKDKMSGGAVLTYINAYGFVSAAKLLKDYETSVKP